jgi:hypothetical protein
LQVWHSILRQDPWPPIPPSLYRRPSPPIPFRPGWRRIPCRRLQYDESESLLRFLDFQRERRGEPPIYADYGQLCDHLSEIYPDVEFNLADHRIVARVKSGVSGSLIDQIGFISSHIPHLKMTIGFGSDGFEVVFRADGIGVIKEDSLPCSWPSRLVRW